MQIAIAVIGGVILGWIIEWVIDWVYWRRSLPGFYARESELLDQAQASQQELEARREELGTLREELAALREEVAAATARSEHHESQTGLLRTQNTELSVRLAETVAALDDLQKQRRDDLEQITGIGPVFEQRLFDAGIETYAQLASASPAKLREILGIDEGRQDVQIEAWRTQAREFAEIMAVEVLPYRLEEIKGIGPVYVQRLNEAGIHTYADLAQATPKQLREIVQPNNWQAVDFGEWIKQAKLFSRLSDGDRPPLPLEKIKGIGPAFAARLEAAGISTFADLAAADQEQVQEIIGSRGAGVSNVARWIAQAKERAPQSDPDQENGEEDDTPPVSA